MGKPNYKLICWGDLSIPVALKFNWLARDKSGSWWLYVEEPILSKGIWTSCDGCTCRAIPSNLNVPPPEPGPWYEQLYWIG